MNLPVLLPASAHAAQVSAPVAGGGLRLLAGLLLVLGLMFLLYAASRRGLRWLPNHRESRIQIHETRPLGGRKSLCLVEVRGRELLIGVSGERITLLCELGTTAKPSFAETLRNQSPSREPVS